MDATAGADCDADGRGGRVARRVVRAVVRARGTLSSLASLASSAGASSSEEAICWSRRMPTSETVSEPMLATLPPRGKRATGRSSASSPDSYISSRSTCSHRPRVRA